MRSDRLPAEELCGFLSHTRPRHSRSPPQATAPYLVDWRRLARVRFAPPPCLRASGFRECASVDRERWLRRVQLGPGCGIACKVLDAYSLRREHRVNTDRTGARVSGAVRRPRGDEDDRAGADLLRVVAERDLCTSLLDHDQLADRVGMERDPITRGNLFNDQRD